MTDHNHVYALTITGERQLQEKCECGQLRTVQSPMDARPFIAMLHDVSDPDGLWIRRLTENEEAHYRELLGLDGDDGTAQP